jgi:hypothetical protein
MLQEVSLGWVARLMLAVWPLRAQAVHRLLALDVSIDRGAAGAPRELDAPGSDSPCAIAVFARFDYQMNDRLSAVNHATRSSACGRDPVWTNVSCMAAQFDRQVSGNEFRSLVGRRR